MNYQEASSKIFSRGTIPNGYFGDRESVGFAFDAESGKTICVCEHGLFTHHNPQAMNEAEALYLLRHHPINRQANPICITWVRDNLT